MMKAILVDPFNREIRVVDDAFDDYRVLQQYLAQGKRGPLAVPVSSGPRVKFGHPSFVDDEGCYREGQQWFRITGCPSALGGYCLITGERMTDDGPDTGDADVELASMLPYAIEWVTPENAQADFPPITVSALNADGSMETISETPIDFTERHPMETSK